MKHIHIVGICGVLTSAIASAFHKAGWKVTGSDKGFYPPVSTQLDSLGIEYYAGWHPEKMVAQGVPDIVIIATASGSKNPEMLYAKEHGIPTASYTDILQQYFIRPHSIVCVGTWGKTTTSTLLSFILEKAELDPSYMFGGISLSHEASAKISQGEWSVMEGDEYKSGPTDPTAKFFYYKPTHLLMTSISWDHADLYPTFADYLAAFRKLVQMTRTNNPELRGRIVSCIDNTLLETMLIEENMPHTTYGKEAHAHYRYEGISHTKNGLAFDIIHQGKKYPVQSPMLGVYNAENITGAFAMALEIGIPAEKILSAIAEFKGIKRRLEKRYEGNVTVIDTHAPTPEKAQAGLESVREVYDKKIIAIFEPNIGGRQRASQQKYDHAFATADEVLIPHLTKLKIDAAATEEPIEGPELATLISKTHTNTHYIEDDAMLVKKALDAAKKGDVIVFLGSHGFRGMIEEIVTSLRQQSQ